MASLYHHEQKEFLGGWCWIYHKVSTKWTNPTKPNPKQSHFPPSYFHQVTLPSLLLAIQVPLQTLSLHDAMLPVSCQRWHVPQHLSIQAYRRSDELFKKGHESWSRYVWCAFFRPVLARGTNRKGKSPSWWHSRFFWMKKFSLMGNVRSKLNRK